MSTDLHVTRIAHSCHLIEIGGQVILTDPWFTVTPTYDPGEAVARSVRQLPELAAVVISHEHYDHCDLDALARYRDLGVPVVVPPTVASPPRRASTASPRSPTCSRAGSGRSGSAATR